METEPTAPNLRARIERLEELVSNHGERLQEHRDDLNGLADDIGTVLHTNRTPKPQRDIERGATHTR